MSPDPAAQLAARGIEPTYGAREAAAMLGRSYSWLDQSLRDNEFTLPEGTKVEPRRTAGGYVNGQLKLPVGGPENCP
jgi:hypothetical protein